MALLDNAKNFAKVTVSIGYNNSATSIVLTTGHGAKLPTAPFNATWWNSTDYSDPSDDPNVEIVRVTAIATDTLTVVRGQESITATTKNTGSKTYQMLAGLTAKSINTDLFTMYNVKRYGALGDDSNDDTTSIQAAVDAAHAAGGGTVFFPSGTFKISAAIKLYTGTTPTITSYNNISLLGSGSDANAGTIIKQYTTGADCIAGLNDTNAQAINNTIKNLSLFWGTATLTNSGNGIYLKQQQANGLSFQQWVIENVVASSFQGSGKYGFKFESMITSSVISCEALICANGFQLNGAVGGDFGSVSTSVTFMNCFANMATNGVVGFSNIDNTYISFIGCAVDIGANSTGKAYYTFQCSSVSFYACGCELDGTSTLTTMWYIDASSQIGLYNNYSFQSNASVDILVTGTSTGITIVGHQDNSTVVAGPSTGLKVDAGSQVTEIDCNFANAGLATARNLASTAAWYTPGQVRVSAITSSATPTANCGTTDLFDITAAAAGMTIAAPTGTPVNGQKIVYRFKDNATARSIAWNAVFVAGGVPLPATTVLSKILEVGFEYDTANTLNKWRCIASVQET